MIFVKSIPMDLNLQLFGSKSTIADTNMSAWYMATRPSTFVRVKYSCFDIQQTELFRIFLKFQA